MTTTKYAAKFGNGLINTHRAIRSRQRFDAGNLYAFEGKAYKRGRLSRIFWHLIDDADYVVYSYQTPIAWHSASLGWIVPAYSFSATTSGHQSTVRNALSGNGAYVSGRGWVYPGDDLGQDNGYIPFERPTPGAPAYFEGHVGGAVALLRQGYYTGSFAPEPSRVPLSKTFTGDITAFNPGDVVKVTFTDAGYVRTIEPLPATYV
jgi:hypothetical protein